MPAAAGGIAVRDPPHRKFVLRLSAVAGLTVLFPTLNCLQRGQIGVVLLYPLLLGFRLVLLGKRRTSWFLGGVVLALPVVLKLTPILPVGMHIAGAVHCRRGLDGAPVRQLKLSHRRTSRVRMAKGSARQVAASSDACVTPLPPPYEGGEIRQRIRRATQTFHLRNRANLTLEQNGMQQRWWRSRRPFSLSPPLLVSLSFFLGRTLAGVVIFALLMPASLIGWHANLGHLETWYTRVATKVDHDRTDHFAGDGTTVRNQSLSNAVQRFGNWAAFEFAGGPDDRLVDHNAAALGTMPMDRPLVHSLLLAARAGRRSCCWRQSSCWAAVATTCRWDWCWGSHAWRRSSCRPWRAGIIFCCTLPAVIYGGLWMRERRPEKSALWFAAVPMLLCLVHYLALKYAGRIGVLGIGTTVWFFVAADLCCRRVAAESGSDDVDQRRASTVPTDSPLCDAARECTSGL